MFSLFSFANLGQIHCTDPKRFFPLFEYFASISSLSRSLVAGSVSERRLDSHARLASFASLVWVRIGASREGVLRISSPVSQLSQALSL